jgi:hypothetical protein
MDQNNIGRGSPLAFILAYGWGILLFLALFASLAVGIYWIAAAITDKIRKESGLKRAKTIAWTVGIVGSIAVTSLGLFVQFGPTH